ncbi:hypothetical protein STTU_4491 [Streptomyces sp. Tu6071]|nr:hypothetical protein STTU_4491 [Streptomyces sp. Tu6071]
MPHPHTQLAAPPVDHQGADIERDGLPVAIMDGGRHRDHPGEAARDRASSRRAGTHGVALFRTVTLLGGVDACPWACWCRRVGTDPHAGHRDEGTSTKPHSGTSRTL